MRKPTGRMQSVSDQATQKAIATQDLTTSERPLHNYVAEVSERTVVRVGVPLPLGTHARGEGVNFAFFSRHASHVRLELFDHPEDATAARMFDLDPARNCTGDVWHIWIEGIRPGQLYAYRVDGPYQPRDGHRFNFNKLLLDPFATAISRLTAWEFGPARGYDDGDSVCSMVNNAGADAVDFNLPPVLPGTRWHLAVDISREAPQDLFAAGEEPLWEDPQTYHLSPRTSAILVARGTDCQGRQTSLTEAK